MTNPDSDPAARVNCIVIAVSNQGSKQFFASTGDDCHQFSVAAVSVKIVCAWSVSRKVIA